MTTTTTITKLCTGCNQDLPLTAFSMHKRTRDGFQTWCKSCHADYWQRTKPDEYGER